MSPTPKKRAAGPARTPRAAPKSRPVPRPQARTGEHAPVQAASRPVGVAIITVSDTRRAAEDTSGAHAERLLVAAGARVASRAWVRDEVIAIQAEVKRALARSDTDAVVLTGGTGMAPRDVTPEAVEPLLDRRLPGFGERFRALSWSSVRSAAWLSRAGAGVARGRLVVYLPGSSGAVREALEMLLLPELVHAVRLLGRL